LFLDVISLAQWIARVSTVPENPYSHTEVSDEHESHGSSDVPGSLRELIYVALPLMVSAGSLALMNVVDRAFLIALDLDAFAAAMPVSMLNWTVMSIPMGITSYTNAFLSQYEGAKQKDRVAATIWQGLIVGIAGGVLLLPFIFIAPSIFAWMDHAPAVRAQQIPYFRVLVFCCIPLMIATVFSAFFTARKRVNVVMYVNIVATLINIVLDYGLIFGHFGLPKMGIQGAALATVLSQWCVCALYIYLVRAEAKNNGYNLRAAFGFDRELISRMIRYGFPSGLQMLLDAGAFTMFLVLVGRYGTQEQAATTLAFILNSVAFVPMFGMGTAVMTIVGRRVGEGRPKLARATVWKSMVVSGIYMLGFAIIYLTLPDLILKPLLPSNSEVDYDTIRPIVYDLLKFVSLYTFFDAMAVVYGSAVRGAGDTKFSLIFTVITAWLLMVLPTAWLVRNNHSLYECWAAVTFFIFVLGAGFWWRFQAGKWESMKVIESEFDDLQPSTETDQRPPHDPKKNGSKDQIAV